ncbi:MAG: aminopeptidase P family protein [candidate division Zixibacteria bacterium]|nr:aminopeptidase P family protein [candidate division Zixibacteria bacterium]
MDTDRIRSIQGELARMGLDGWLIYDFHRTNDVAVSFLNLEGIVTRRSFYYIPTSGTPIAFVHNIEKKPFEKLPGEKFYYSSYRILEEKLRKTLTGKKRLAMEYSPLGRLPYIGKVDAGTIELIKSYGVEIVSSADLVGKFDACLDDEQIIMHKEAAVKVNEIKDAAFVFIKDRLISGKKVIEYDVAQFILESFNKAGMVTDHSPICGVRENGGNPHYEPTAEYSIEIKKDDLILIDLWAKFDKPRAIYADMTWMAFAGNSVPEQYVRDFTLVTMARDAAVDYITLNWDKKKIFGYAVDDVCRGVIMADGSDLYFTHRTGHSIAESVHGPGPNIDNLETEDRRRLMPGHLFSIEPGLYFDDHGVRTEIDVLITENGPEVTTQPVQKDIVLLFD